MPMIIDGTNGLTFPDNSRQYNGYFGFKNRIINGDMRIDQRNAGAAVTVNSGTEVFPVDRFVAQGQSADGVFTLQRSTVAPAGFTNSLLATVTTADSSIGSTQFYFIQQKIEGFNVADLAWGTASAQTVTVSFWVRSSLTGTFAGSLTNDNATRSYPFAYTISAANTWEQKSVIIPGDTTGTWLTNNGIGLRVYFNIGAGSSYTTTAGAWASQWAFNATGATNLIATNGATWQVTGVQLEEGVVSTNFDVLPYGTQLSLCQRYFLLLGGVSTNDNVSAGQAFSTTSGAYSVRFPVAMRATPTLDTFTASNWSVLNGTGGLVAATAISLAGGQTSTLGCQISATVASGLTAGQGSQLLANTVNARLPFNSEL